LEPIVASMSPPLQQKEKNLENKLKERKRKTDREFKRQKATRRSIAAKKMTKKER